MNIDLINGWYEQPHLEILVADDSLTNFHLLAMLLEKVAGVTPDHAIDGMEVIDRVSAQRYDLILMDRNMPQMDGIESTRFIRNLHGEQRPPFIAGVSGSANAREVREFLDAGADSFFAKPVRLADLKLCVDLAFQHKQTLLKQCA